MSSTAQGVLTSRRADMDSLRALALALLIIYHVLLVYTGREFWRVNSAYHGYWADYLIALVSPWRMALVFFIGGVAVRFMLSRPSFGAFVRERAARLLTAFVFAITVLVPPQAYVRLDEAGVAESYLQYWVQEAPFATSYFQLRLPQFAHAWFLPYLFVYSVLLAALWWFAPKRFVAVEGAVQKLPIWVMAWFAVHEWLILPMRPEQRVVFTDFVGHLKFFPMFVLGVMLGKSVAFQQRLGAAKVRLWLAAGAMMLLSIGLEYAMLHGADALTIAWRLARGLYGGAMLFSVVAFGAWALNRPSPALTYVSDAILPVYLLHQTMLIIVGDWVIPQHWPFGLELVSLLASATLIPIALYHLLIRRVPPLRFLFGLRPKLRTGIAGPDRSAYQDAARA